MQLNKSKSSLAYLFLLSLANSVVVWLAWPEFVLPRGSHIRPIMPVCYAFVFAVVALTSIRQASRHLGEGIRQRRLALGLLGIIGIMLSLLPLPLYRCLTTWAEHRQALVVEK